MRVARSFKIRFSPKQEKIFQFMSQIKSKFTYTCKVYYHQMKLHKLHNKYSYINSSSSYNNYRSLQFVSIIKAVFRFQYCFCYLSCSLLVLLPAKQVKFWENFIILKTRQILVKL